MNQDEYNNRYLSFKQSGQFDISLIQEFLYEKGEKFDLNQFFQALNILNNPFQAMNQDLSKYQGIDFQKIMIDIIIAHYDKKFNIQRCDINFSQMSDKRYFKTLIQKYPNGMIHI